jgi:uncharacterized membrane protein YraQ (UPF0718 family)
VSERLAYWLFGIALSAALTVAVARNLVAERTPKTVVALGAMALLLGLLIGWAINGYIDYVRASALRF